MRASKASRSHHCVLLLRLTRLQKDVFFALFPLDVWMGMLEKKKLVKDHALSITIYLAIE
jgi:hypothetical protein